VTAVLHNGDDPPALTDRRYNLCEIGILSCANMTGLAFEASGSLRAGLLWRVRDVRGEEAGFIFASGALVITPQSFGSKPRESSFISVDREIPAAIPSGGRARCCRCG
jgi:hypothetical protein